MFLDFSKNTILSKKQAKLYFIYRLILIFVFFISAFIFLLELAFPTNHFNLTGDIRYRIEKPKTIKNITTFSIVPPREMDSLQLLLKIDKNSILPEHIEIDLYKSYGAFFYDISDEKNDTNNNLNTEQPLPNNSLFSSKNSVYISNNFEKFPFDSVETLIMSGYNFDNILKTTEKERSYYKKGDLLSLSDYHIVGTIFYATDTNTYFKVINDKKIIKIPHSTSKNIIKIKEKSKKIHSTCVLNKKILPFNTYSCNFNLTDIIDFPGKRFIFYTKDLTTLQIKAIETVFYTKKSKKNLIKRLSQIKNLIISRNN